MKFIKQNFLSLVILALIGVIFFKDGCKPAPVQVPTITIKRDTIHYYHDSVVYSKPQIVKQTVTPVSQRDTFFFPDTTYSGLRRQFDSLSNAFFTLKTYRDTLKVDSIGYVTVQDSVYRNELIGRQYEYNIRERQITNTITITQPAPKRTQLFVGGGVAGNPQSLVRQAEVGLLLKNKKDQIYGLKAGIDITGQPLYGIQMYWKIGKR